MKNHQQNIEKNRISLLSEVDIQEKKKKEEDIDINKYDNEQKEIFEIKKKKKRLSKGKGKINIKVINSQEDVESDNTYIDDETFKDLQKLTMNFELTYKEIKNSKELKSKPLSNLSKEEIQYHIRKERQNLNRKYGAQLDKDNNKFCQRFTYKRKRPNYFEESENESSQKRLKNGNENCEVKGKETYNDLAKTLIRDFNNHDTFIQNQMIGCISFLIENDSTVLTKTLQNQVIQNKENCLKYFKERDYKNLKTILDDISPMSTIIINFEISKEIPNLINESNTLAQTFLPYLNFCPNFEFLNSSYILVAKQMIHTLVKYYLDTSNIVDYGFVNLALHFDSSILQPVIQTQSDQIVLFKSFLRNGFNSEESRIMSQNSKNFLWAELQEFLNVQHPQARLGYIRIFSKLVILQNPGPLLQELMDCFALRNVFITALQECPDISLTIKQLILVLESLSNLNTETITKIFKEDPKSWNKLVVSKQEMEQLSSEQLSQEQIDKFIQEIIIRDNLIHSISQEIINNISHEVELQCQTYQHNLYQCAITSLIISQEQQYKIVEMPTGSGKTWIQALISKYFTSKQKKVTIIEPNENLREQTQEQLQDLSHDLQILTIDQFYEFPPSDEIIIVNEYDNIIENMPFKVVSQGLTGLWQLQNRQVIFFTATTNTCIEKIVKYIFKDFIKLKFQSEYEMTKNVSSISQGQIYPCKTQEEQFQKIKDDIIKHYNNKPIIIFCEAVNINKIQEILIKNQCFQYRVGSSSEILKEIRNWKLGILILLPEDGIGINCKFGQDSIVLITNKMHSQAQYIQTQGRSSRARGLCSSIYYPLSTLGSKQILRDMNNQHMTRVLDLERVIKVIWSKRNVKGIIEIIEEAQNKGDLIRTMKDLQQVLGNLKYSQILKGIQF